jgi:hypothetical protein
MLVHLVGHTIKWVEAKFEKLCAAITADLEKEPYEKQFSELRDARLIRCRRQTRKKDSRAAAFRFFFFFHYVPIGVFQQTVSLTVS